MSVTEQVNGWQLDEAGARTYERFLVPALMAPWAEDLVDAVGVGTGQRVLDVACGTGIVARTAARAVGAGGSVVGVDVNPAMLAIAAEVATSDLPIRWEQADAHEIPIADGSVDIVLCQQGLQFFADPSNALREMLRVGTEGARLGVSTCASIERQPGYRALRDVVTGHLGVDAGAIIASPYTLGEPDVVRRLVAAAGFGDVRLRRVITTFRAPSPEAFLRGETTSSPLGVLIDVLDDDVVAGLIADLGRALRPFSDDDGIVFPFETLVLTAAP
jgi:ubiquinone/menaquinone biosynthesis C-methylase UbiE